jgi:hypothetical protein
MNFPRTVEEITPESLTRVLRESGTIEMIRLYAHEVGSEDTLIQYVSTANRSHHANGEGVNS